MFSGSLPQLLGMTLELLLASEICDTGHIAVEKAVSKVSALLVQLITNYWPYPQY